MPAREPRPKICLCMCERCMPFSDQKHIDEWHKGRDMAQISGLHCAGELCSRQEQAEGDAHES